jgi:hypothetical protein
MKKKTATKRRPKKRVAPIVSEIRSGPFNGLTAEEADAALQRKILLIAGECPEIEATGEIAEQTGEAFKFTVYCDVMKRLVPLLVKHRLTFVPYADSEHPTKLDYIHGWHYLTTHYRLGDAETGYGIIVPGFGMNRWWAADSAGTLALKHALLQTLHIHWDNRTEVERMVASYPHYIGDIVSEVMKQIAERNEGADINKFDWKGYKTTPKGAPQK